MSKGRIRLGLLGGGPNSFIGPVHRIAAYMGERYRLIGGVLSSNIEEGNEFARKLELDPDRNYKDLDELIAKESLLPENQRMEAVAILTPNFLHYEMAMKLVDAGFHVICEKPVTVTAHEAGQIEKLVEKRGIVFCVTHTYTGYPMVRQMRAMIADGIIGKIHKVDAQYYQGWINPFIHEKDKRKGIWRLDPEKSGQSCCFGDIGVHAFNLIEYTTGLVIEKVLSDIDTLYDDNPLDVDGTALIHTTDGVKGVIRASQIASGEENNIQIMIYGEKGGLKWSQEDPTYLYYLRDGEPAQLLKPGQPYNTELAMTSTKIAPGHPEGLFDAMGNIYTGAAKAIRGEEFDVGEYPGIKDGVRGMKFIEAVLESSRKGQLWISI